MTERLFMLSLQKRICFPTANVISYSERRNLHPEVQLKPRVLEIGNLSAINPRQVFVPSTETLPALPDKHQF